MLVSLVVVATIPALNVLGGAASASFDEQAVALSGTEVSSASAATPAPTPPASPTPTPTPTPIPNVAPNASFTATCTHLTCTFTDTSTDPDAVTDPSIVGWQWSYGDSTESTTQHGEHTYASGGTYEVTLQVTDGDGATASWSLDVAPTDPPPVADVGLAAKAEKDAKLWIATFAIAVTDASKTAAPPLAGVVVVGEVSKLGEGDAVVKESATCTTGADGACAVTVEDLSKTTQSVTFTVTKVAHDGWVPTDRPSATSINPTEPEDPGDKGGKSK